LPFPESSGAAGPGAVSSVVKGPRNVAFAFFSLNADSAGVHAGWRRALLGSAPYSENEVSRPARKLVRVEPSSLGTKGEYPGPQHPPNRPILQLFFRSTYFAVGEVAGLTALRLECSTQENRSLSTPQQNAVRLPACCPCWFGESILAHLERSQDHQSGPLRKCSLNVSDSAHSDRSRQCRYVSFGPSGTYARHFDIRQRAAPARMPLRTCVPPDALGPTRLFPSNRIWRITWDTASA